MTKIQKKVIITGVPAGFPAPSSDFGQETIDLNELLIEHPAATYYIQVQGHSMIKAGIHSGDLLVVDRSKEPKEGSIIVAVVDGEFTVKRVREKNGRFELVPESDAYEPINIREGMQFEVWGVVTHVIHKI